MSIDYEDFAKVEITLGTIVNVEIIPEADRLLKLTVDFGEESPRQVVSGIREYVSDLEALIGKQSPFITNLEPRNIRGYESQAMILAANDDDTFAFFHPSTALPPGTKLI